MFFGKVTTRVQETFDGLDRASQTHDDKRLDTFRSGGEFVWLAVHEGHAGRTEIDPPHDEDVAFVEEPSTAERRKVLDGLALIDIIVDTWLTRSLVIVCVRLDLLRTSRDNSCALARENLGANPVEDLTIKLISCVDGYRSREKAGNVPVHFDGQRLKKLEDS